MKKILYGIILSLCILALSSCAHKTDSGNNDATKQSYAVKIVVDFQGNLIFSKYDVDIQIDGKRIKTLNHGKDETIDILIEEGNHIVCFMKHGDSTIKEEVALSVTSDLEVAYKIACYRDRITHEIVYTDYAHIPDGMAAISGDLASFSQKKIEETIMILKGLGFTNVQEQPLGDVSVSSTSNGLVNEVIISGRTNYKRGDQFDSDVMIVVTYHSPRENITAEQTMPVVSADSEETSIPITTENESTVSQEASKATTPKHSWESHSSGDRSIAKEGDRGIYAYIDDGPNYSLYYIIDFDEGYVYSFCYGNGDNSGSRVAIVQGSLNDAVIITYHDGRDIWSETLYFSWAKQPDSLILVDHNGFEYRFLPTNLEKALSIRDSMQMIDY